ncbi:MAG: SGNH/GDSL hydrolase family protein [Muribaculaceae bacterium]|nr:SGNH/GDSL hydrolase family protein [Muribaculaceae bacterium]
MKNKIFRIAALSAVMLVSANFAASSQSKKSVSVLGDSYSTFENYIEPKSNEMWYFVHPNPDLTDVNDVRQTWWHQLIKEGGYRLEQNNSYSGSTICTTGYRGEDYTPRAFITRMDNLGCPDILLIFGATNDSWANSPIGEFVWSDWTEEQLKSFRPALTYMLSHIVDRYPNTELLYIINDGLKPEITSSIVEACDHYGVPYVQLKDIDKTAGHPNIKGMKQIKEQVAAALK